MAALTAETIAETLMEYVALMDTSDEVSAFEQRLSALSLSLPLQQHQHATNLLHAAAICNRAALVQHLVTRHHYDLNGTRNLQSRGGAVILEGTAFCLTNANPQLHNALRSTWLLVHVLFSTASSALVLALFAVRAVVTLSHFYQQGLIAVAFDQQSSPVEAISVFLSMFGLLWLVVLSGYATYAFCTQLMWCLISSYWRFDVQFAGYVVREIFGFREEQHNYRPAFLLTLLAPGLYACALGISFSFFTSIAPISGQLPVYLNPLVLLGAGVVSVLGVLRASSSVAHTPYVYADSQRAMHGWTPLHISAGMGHTETAAVLMRLGADPDLLTHAGCTPLHIARTLSNAQAMIELLEEA